ncbi:MAG: XTP/dITP diphosphatase [Methanosarcinales archaeon]|nr:XTP/dITP diphosphatase [Methanosarcinales archaeon]
MRKIYFATGNTHKLIEARGILKLEGYEVELVDCPYPELQADELETISACGAQWCANHLDKAVMVDDSGIFIEVLNGFPGPYSRYVEDHLGNRKILKLMEAEQNRTAVFKTVVGFCEPGNEPHTFAGEVKGTIAFEEQGEHGFGYDPIFLYKGYTFGELEEEEKNPVSHRGNAMRKFARWLGERNPSHRLSNRQSR